MLISEWLPNPSGSDSSEWVELFNNSNATVDLTGLSLKTIKGKPVLLHGVVPAHGYTVLKKSDLKFTLRNSDETLSLLGPGGKIIDQSSYRGVAEEGKSVNHSGRNSFFGEPTPGAANISTSLVLINEPHPFNVALDRHSSKMLPVGQALTTGIILAILLVFIIQQFNGLSELFFGSY